MNESKMLITNCCFLEYNISQFFGDFIYYLYNFKERCAYEIVNNKKLERDKKKDARTILISHKSITGIKMGLQSKI